ncbi:unnamed protein product [Dovyalis caffra]|uniref:Uncharacterized protein n=1 Tax=Dovyalis caffra TaxID=77055 RepID=A0AAV1S9Q6_9ROSI|nr:unnamed protein product [Dovyalis caffra]
MTELSRPTNGLEGNMLDPIDVYKSSGSVYYDLSNQKQSHFLVPQMQPLIHLESREIRTGWLWGLPTWKTLKSSS